MDTMITIELPRNSAVAVNRYRLYEPIQTNQTSLMLLLGIGLSFSTIYANF